MGKGVAIAGSFIDKKMTFVSVLHKEPDVEARQRSAKVEI